MKFVDVMGIQYRCFIKFDEIWEVFQWLIDIDGLVFLEVVIDKKVFVFFMVFGGLVFYEFIIYDGGM